MENDTQTPSEQAEYATHTRRKSITLLIIGVITLLMASLVLGMLFYFEKTEADSLHRQVTELREAQEEMDKQMAEEEAGKTKRPQVAYREIPELGVKYKVTDQTKDLTYAFEASEGVSLAMFSTKELMQLKDSNNLYPCKHGSVGLIAKYKNSSLAREGASVKEIGGAYFTVTAPQAACLINGIEAPGLTDGLWAVEAAFKTLEAM